MDLIFTLITSKTSLYVKSFLLSSSLMTIKDSRERREKEKQRVVYGQIVWDKVIQNIVTAVVLTICPVLASRQTSLTHWQTIIFRTAAADFQHSEVLVRHIKMSLFRMEHIIPAKFVGLKPLSMRIKRPFFLVEIGLSIVDLSACER